MNEGVSPDGSASEANIPMTFHPRMKSSLKGISVIGGLNSRSWNGIVADVWQVRCHDAEGEYESPDPRLFVALDMRGNGRFILDDGGAKHVSTPSISYVPAGKFLRLYSNGVNYVQHLDLHFDVATLRRRFGGSLDDEHLNEQRLNFHDEGLLAICRLIAAECVTGEPLHSLYGDGLSTALVARLFGLKDFKERRRSKLTEQQLRLATDFMEGNFQHSIRLNDLAELTGLSESQFSHAFKATVGMPPYRWHQEFRVKKVQELLATHDWPLTQVAAAVGFADQAHLTRVFKRVTGLTPAFWARQCAWRRK
jgi:AraC-like DNA-binding protein